MNPPQPAGYPTPPPLLPFQPDLVTVSEGISVEVKRKQIGNSRQQAATFYPHAAIRSQKASYTLRGADIWTMLQFFQDVAGPGGSFWASTTLQAAKLTANVAAADTVLHVEDTNGVLVNDYIALNANGQFISCAQVTALDPVAKTITISAAPGVGINANAGLIYQLCLV